MKNHLTKRTGVSCLLFVLTVSCAAPSDPATHDKLDDSGGDTETNPTAPIDSESSTGEPSEGPSCLHDPNADSQVVYPEGVTGASCSLSEPCPTGGLCSNLMFPESGGYSGAKCYPACATDAPDEPCCAAGDRCLRIGQADDSRACLAVGHARKQQLSLRIWPKGSTPDHTGIAVVSLDVVANGQKVPLNMAYAIEDTTDFDGDGTADDVIIVEFEGIAGALGTWVLQITVPKQAWIQGKLQADRFAGDSGFEAVLTKWVGKKMTIAAVSTSGSLAILEAGAPCGAPPCDKATISFDFEIVSISASLTPEPGDLT